MKLTLRDAAEYVRTRRASSIFLRILVGLGRIFDFGQERGNRLKRFIAITKAYAKGEAVQDIADEYDCDRSTVMRYARLVGLPKRPKHFSADIRAEVIADYKRKDKSGEPLFQIKQIAEMNSVSPAYVSKIAREEGISRYAPRPKKRRAAARH